MSLSCPFTGGGQAVA